MWCRLTKPVTCTISPESRSKLEIILYGHFIKFKDEYVGKRVMAMEVPGKRRRGRPKRRWLDSTGNDLSETRKTELDGGVS